MIEIIYKDEQQKKNGESFVKIPKNIRQIGTSGQDHKIYIEDYAMTYLKRDSAEDKKTMYGILTGKQIRENGVVYTFISGLICAPDREGLPVFSEEIWKELRQEKKKYFPNSEIVGWYADFPYYNGNIQIELLRLHVEQFSKGDKVCYIKDRREGEAGFYRYENGILKKQGGYAVYFEKNESLEKYFLEHQIGPETKKEFSFARQNGGSFRESLRKRTEHVAWNRRMAQIGATAAALVLLVTAITVFQQNGTIAELTDSVSQMAAQLRGETQGSRDVVVEAVHGNVKPEETTEAEKDTTVDQETNKGEEKTTVKEEATKEKETSTKKAKETVAVDTNVSYYTVKKGETLFQICMKIYNDANMLEILRKTNDIPEDYSIYEGQKLILP